MENIPDIHGTICPDSITKSIPKTSVNIKGIEIHYGVDGEWPRVGSSDDGGLIVSGPGHHGLI